MALNIGSRFKNAWNVFFNRDPTPTGSWDMGPGYIYRPDRIRLSRGNEKSIITSIYNRIGTDASSLDIKHVRIDENNRFKETIDSGLNYCLTTEANIDQTGRAFRQDIIMSMLNEGVVAVVPIDTDIDPMNTDSYKILTMRTGQITEWFPENIRVKIYNDRTGRRQEIIVPKSKAAIIENPFYAVMNEPNSTMQRLIRKLNLLDVIDEQSGSGKLDLIIQLPYVIKSQARKDQADIRRKEIEEQLTGSKYGIAYTDGTEKITQLNRSVDNNLMKQIEYLTSMLYSQLGITQAILDGTADEQTMLNYQNHILEPILSAIVEEMRRKFLTKTARSQNQSVMYFIDPFKFVTSTNLTEAADKYTRNEIVSPNEMRQVLGMIPSNDPKADELRNRNISAAKGAEPAKTEEIASKENLKGGKNQNG